jgi:hypothetical protein
MGYVFAWLLNGALAPLALAAAAPSTAACAPIPGWDQVLADPKLHWIVIGELHGTAETPAIFADAVCLTAAKRGPVVVALEMPTRDQAAIDAFIASDGGPVARSEFFKALIWHMGNDGRSSQAVFAMFERLRQMHLGGRVSRVVAFQDVDTRDPPSVGQGPYEERLAKIVSAAGAQGATVVALVGSLHARKTEANFGKPFMPMATHLPADQTLTLYADGNGGSAWFCNGPKPTDCGPHEVGAAGELGQRGAVLRPVMEGAYDGLLDLGVPTTASPPQPTD